MNFFFFADHPLEGVFLTDIKGIFLLCLFLSRKILVLKKLNLSFLTEFSYFWLRVRMFSFFGTLFSTRIFLFFWIRFRINPYSSFVLIFGPSPRARFPSKLSYHLLLFMGKSPLKANKFFLILGRRSEGPRFRTGRPAVRVPCTKGNRGKFWVIFWPPVELSRAQSF